MADDPDIEIEAIELETTVDESDSAEHQAELNEVIDTEVNNEDKREGDPQTHSSSSSSTTTTTTTSIDPQEDSSKNNSSTHNNTSKDKTGFYNRPCMFSCTNLFFSRHPLKKRIRLFLMEFEEHLFLLLTVLVLSLLFAIVIVLVGVVNWSSKSLMINELETIDSGLGSSSSARWFECIQAQGLAKNDVTLMRFESEPPLTEESVIDFYKDVSLYPATTYFYRHFHLRNGDRGGLLWTFTAPVSFFLLREKEWNLFQAGRPIAATSTGSKGAWDFNITVTDNYFFVFKGSGTIGGARNGRVRLYATTKSYNISDPIQVITKDGEGCCLPFNSPQVCVFVGPQASSSNQTQVNTEISYRITKRLWFTVSVLSTIYLTCVVFMSVVWKFCITRSTQQSINQKVSDITTAVVHGNTSEIIREMQDVTTPARERPSRRLLVEEDEEDPPPNDEEDGDAHQDASRLRGSEELKNIVRDDGDDGGEGTGVGVGVGVYSDEDIEVAPENGGEVSVDISDMTDEREY